MSNLVCFVHVSDEAGKTCAFGPGDYVPDWARAKITNPHVWDTPPVEESSEAPAVTVAPSDDGPPPQGGPGASRQKWADYAAKKDVEVEESWKREDIIAACEKAGIRV